MEGGINLYTGDVFDPRALFTQQEQLEFETRYGDEDFFQEEEDKNQFLVKPFEEDFINKTKDLLREFKRSQSTQTEDNTGIVDRYADAKVKVLTHPAYEAWNKRDYQSYYPTENKIFTKGTLTMARPLVDNLYKDLDTYPILSQSIKNTDIEDLIKVGVQSSDKLDEFLVSRGYRPLLEPFLAPPLPYGGR